MNEPIRILIVEDLPTDAELAQREIQQVLALCVFRRVETEADYLAALEVFQPDVIISDYSMPHFDGLTALHLALERMPLTPVIILTGALNEDTAVECMKAGAVDYVIKEHIKRLGQAVLHALEQKRLREERRRSEVALHQSEERYRAVSELTSDFAYAVGIAPDGSFVPEWTTDAFTRITGYDLDFQSSVRDNWMSLVYPDDLPIALEHLQANLSGRTDVAEYRIVDKSGRVHWVREYGQPFWDEAEGRVVRIIGAAQDITEHKQAEEQLLLQANLLRNVSDSIISTDLNFTITSWNTAAETIYGWHAHEVIGKPLNEILRAEGPLDSQEDFYHALHEHGIWEGELLHRHKNGTPINIMASISFVKDSTGRPIGTVTVNRDITERKRAIEAQTGLEEQLRQSQRLESIGRLAGGVAHDFNNLLTVIEGYCDLIQSELPSDDPLIADVNQIRMAGDRASALTRQLLAFSRKQILAPTLLDLNDLVANLRKMLERLIGEDITLSTILQPGLWQITADPGQIEQMLMNLVVNARDAMPTGGLLTIETANVHLDDSYASSHIEAPLGPCVMLAVTDTGHGIDAETRTRIFEPFFTTKEPGKGTGLGLSTVYGITKQSGGHIMVYSEVGGGASFKIYLPASATASSHLDSAQPQPVAYGGTETILLAEDEEKVRHLVRMALLANGYTVLDARHGGEALALASQHQGPIDLVVTDVVMPEVSGRDLVERLKTAHPRLKVLFMSGYTDDTVVRHGLLTSEVEYLPKPFSLSTLVAKVREVLDNK